MPFTSATRVTVPPVSNFMLTPDPAFDVPGLTFATAQEAREALEGLSVEEVDALVEKFQEAVDAAGGCKLNWEHFTDYLLAEASMSEKSLIRLAGTSSGQGLHHLAKRDDLTPKVTVVAAVNNIERHLMNQRRSIQHPFGQPDLPDWLLRLGVEAAELVFKKPNPMPWESGLEPPWLKSGLMWNPNLPLLARAHLTPPQWWTRVDFGWCHHDGSSQMEPEMRDQVAVLFPDLADLPAEMVLSVLATLPFDDSWGVPPAEYQTVADQVREKIEQTRLKIQKGLL